MKYKEKGLNRQLPHHHTGTTSSHPELCFLLLSLSRRYFYEACVLKLI